MIRSMTAFGRAIGTDEHNTIIVEMRSVNNRYLDCSPRLPRVFRVLRSVYVPCLQPRA